MMLDEEEEYIEVPLTNDLERRIAAAFAIYDLSGNRVIDVASVPVVVFSLGLVPSEEEMKEIIECNERKKNPGTVHLVTLLPFLVDKINKKMYRPAPLELILDAFQALDSKNAGYFTVEEFKKYLMERGEPFNEDEWEEMLENCYDPFSKTIKYEGYVNKLKVEPKDEDDIYTLADRVEREKLASSSQNARKNSMLLRRSSTFGMKKRSTII